MRTDKTDFAGPLEARLYRAVEQYCAREGLGHRAFGAAATGDAELVPELAGGRSPTLETVDAMLAELGGPPAGPAFDAEVSAFVAVTGIKRSVLGREAANNPSFVAHLERGTSPTLRTVGKVRAWMAAHASPAEARAIRRLAGPMPDLLSDAPRRGPSRPSPERLRLEPGGMDDAREDGDGDLYIDTGSAAALLGLAASTLERYRCTGGGPPYYLLGKRIVRYRREDLADWEAGRRPSREGSLRDARHG